MESSRVDTPSPTETTALPGDGTRKRPTRITANLGYTEKPKRLMGLRMLLLFAAALGVSILLRLLASPDGGPLMAVYNFVYGLISGKAG